ncbi:MAG: TIGR03016 family PEP-CTERM system-associated outer membrane protein [Alkalimonas sp.]|nr:TIGR03016 family PEP-CTERM system-associated outer membrane protein [Alkalimonas sp.]
MATTTPKEHNPFTASAKFSRLILAVGCVMVPLSTAYANATFSPRVTVTGHGYSLDFPSQPESDRGAALEVEPGLAWRYQGARLLTRLDLSHQQVWYEDNERDSFSLNEYRFQNILTGFDRRLTWSVDARQNYSVRAGEGGAIFRDKITNAGELSKTRRFGTALSMETARHKEAQYSLNLSARQTISERPQQDDLLGDIESEQYSLAFRTFKNHEHGGLFWRGSSSVMRTDRAERNRLTQDSVDLLVGVPLLPSLAWTVQGRYDQNNVRNSTFTNEFSSAGSGLEWNFGRISRINVSYNTVLTGRDDGNFVSADFLLAPTRRTSLSGYWDRRYFGRTAQLSGQYNLRFLTMRLSYTDRVSTRNFLETELIDLGVFVCPDDAQDIGDCSNFPGPGYELGVNEQLQQFFDVDTQIRDDVVLNRQGALNIGYSRNRLTLGLRLSSSELDYQEIDRVDRRHNASLETSWRLTPHSRVRANLRGYKYNFSNTGREDKSWQYELGLVRNLSHASDINLSVRHNRRDSNNDNFDFRENRLSVSYKYQF